MGVNNSLLKSMQTIVDKAIEVAPFDKTRQAQVITNNADGTYTIRLDGILYNNVPSYPETNVLEVGSVVKIVMPSNQSSQMYIQSSKGGGGGDHKELTRVQYEALTPEQKNDGTVYFVTDGDPDYFIMSDSVPIGAIQAFGGETAPEGWLICDGSAVSRETYLDLFKAIGTTYGAGDGNTTFNLPDLRGNVAIGVSSNYALGDSGGQETHLHSTGNHTLTLSEIPSHAHGYQRPVLMWGSGGNVAWPSSGKDSKGSDQWGYNSTENVGGGGAHNHGNTGSTSNMQPYIVTNYIIKAFQPPTDNVIKSLDPDHLLLDAFYPVGSCYETTNSNFNPNITWGGTWTMVADSIVIDITKRAVNGTINRARGYSTSITAPSVDGYEFDHWGDFGTDGWVSSLYTEYASNQTTNIWNTITDGSGYGSFHIFAYYVKRETIYRWERTA